MKISTVLFALAGSSAADYMCPAMSLGTDATALQYAFQIQQLLNMYYQSVPVTAEFFSSLPMASMQASNGMTLAENTVTNVGGLAKQAQLAANALGETIGMMGQTFIPPACNYTLPMPTNATAHLMNAFNLEASLCGAFIGLADYFQTPTLNSLSARIAAEHGIHAAAVRAMMQPVGFMPNSSSLTPAFTPEMVLSSGMEVGMLGSYIAGCNVVGPAAPCGGVVSFGPLLSSLDGQSAQPAESSMSSYSGMVYTSTIAPIPAPTPIASDMSATMTTMAPATFTGEGKRQIASAGVGAAAMVMGYMMA